MISLWTVSAAVDVKVGATVAAGVGAGVGASAAAGVCIAVGTRSPIAPRERSGRHENKFASSQKKLPVGLLSENHVERSKASVWKGHKLVGTKRLSQPQGQSPRRDGLRWPCGSFLYT